MRFRRRWESWVIYERAGEKVGERFLHRHFTAKAAFDYAEDCALDPKVLGKMIDTMLEGERAIIVHPDVRERSTVGKTGKVVPVAKRGGYQPTAEGPPPTEPPPRPTGRR